MKKSVPSFATKNHVCIWKKLADDKKEQNYVSEIFEPAGPESTEANLRPEKIQ